MKGNTLQPLQASQAQWKEDSTVSDSQIKRLTREPNLTQAINHGLPNGSMKITSITGKEIIEDDRSLWPALKEAIPVAPT